MMDYQIERGAVSVILHVLVTDTSGDPLAGLSDSSAGLVIASVRPGESSPGVFAQAAGDIEAVAVIGTYAAPTAGKIRFGEIDATNMPGWYELHAPDVLFNTADSLRSLAITLHGAAGMRAAHVRVQLLGASLQGAGVTVATNNDKAGYFLADGSVVTATINDGAFTAAKFAAGAFAAGVFGNGAITAASIAASAFTNAKFAAVCFTSGLFDAGAISASAFAQGAADKVWSTAARQLTGTQTFNLTGTITGNLTGSVGSVSGVTFPSGFNSLTAGAVADAVWDEARSGHVGAGSFGEGVVVKSLATGSIVAASFAAAAITAAAIAADAVDLILDEEIEAGYTFRQVTRGSAAVLMGLRAGGATSTITFTGLDGVTGRVQMYADATGNSVAPPSLVLT